MIVFRILVPGIVYGPSLLQDVRWTACIPGTWYGTCTRTRYNVACTSYHVPGTKSLFCRGQQKEVITVPGRTEKWAKTKLITIVVSATTELFAMIAWI